MLSYYSVRRQEQEKERSMAKRKKGLENSLTQWAYQNKKAGSKMTDIMKSLEEVQKLLGEKKKEK